MQAKAELARAETELVRIELILRRKFGERFSISERVSEGGATAGSASGNPLGRPLGESGALAGRIRVGC